MSTVPFTPYHAPAAADAFLRFGKWRHPSGLNFGDCMSYAVAKAEGLPLLYVGTDFGVTDVVGVLGEGVVPFHLDGMKAGGETVVEPESMMEWVEV
ncbi:MAG: type II toxin-antitoxin system VapC family toxin [Pseudomonadota bacterium]